MTRALGARPWRQPLEPTCHGVLGLVVDRRVRRQVVCTSKVLSQHPCCLNLGLAENGNKHNSNDQQSSCRPETHLHKRARKNFFSGSISGFGGVKAYECVWGNMNVIQVFIDWSLYGSPWTQWQSLNEIRDLGGLKAYVLTRDGWNSHAGFVLLGVAYICFPSLNNSTGVSSINLRPKGAYSWPGFWTARGLVFWSFCSEKG